MYQHPDFKSILLTRHGANETICVSFYKRVNGKFVVEEHFCGGVETASQLIGRNYMREDIGAIWTNIQRLKKGSAARRKSEVEAYTNLTIDIDRRDKRDAGGNKVNASDEEREALRTVAEKIAAFLAPTLGACVFADSGNGFHLNWKLADIEPAEGQRYYRAVLTMLKRKFESPDVNCEIDASLADDTQVVTVWGTWNRKYPEILDRPQRQSKVLFSPHSQKPIKFYDFEIFLNENKSADSPLADPEERPVPGNTAQQKADVEWLESYGVPDLTDFWAPLGIAYEEQPYEKQGETHHPIAPCPCHEGEDFHVHSQPRDCEIIEFADGGIGISCFSGELSLKQVIAKMNTLKGESYPHRVFAEETDEQIAKAFGAESADANHAGINAGVVESETKRKAFREGCEEAIPAERETKKKEALKTQVGRIELGHWVEDIDGVQFMTRITAVSAASVKPKENPATQNPYGLPTLQPGCHPGLISPMGRRTQRAHERC